MAADSGGSNEPLQLEPFIHQVGGHSSMLQLDKDTICKPLIPRELNFYKSAPDSLKEFMAEFKGILEVTFSEALDGYVDLTTYLPTTYKLSPSKTLRKGSLSENEHKYKHRIKLCQSGDIEIESLTYDDVKQTFEKCNNSRSQNGSLLNPWVLRCHKEQMKKLRNASSKVLQKYIMLENRVSKFEFPCILDLKMGTRQYGDDASLAKRHSHTAKAASSTTAVLGVRINGMQVYHQDSGRFICHNKYYGRSLTVDGFHKALLNFLQDGIHLRYDVIASLLEKIRKLHSVVQSLSTFRFFTSSLLIIYSREKSCLQNNKNEKQRTSPLHDNGNVPKKEKDVEDSLAYCKCCDKCSASSDTNKFKGCFPDDCVDENEFFPLVDLCMIDFAHSTHGRMPDSPVVHNGPDEGYLFGLENLIAHLEIIQEKGE